MVHQEIEEREGILDLLPLIELQGAYHLVWDTPVSKGALEYLGLRVRPVEDRRVVIAAEVPYEIRDTLALSRPRRGEHHGRLRPGCAVRAHQVLLVPRLVVRDKGSGRGEDLGRGAVVLLKLYLTDILER